MNPNIIAMWKLDVFLIKDVTDPEVELSLVHFLVLSDL